MLQHKNYEVNRTIDPGEGFINGQALGEVSRMRYGLFPFSYNGCEMIAIYNYMLMLGRPVNLAETAREMYPRSSVLWGLFGSNPYLLKSFFTTRSLPVSRVCSYKRLKAEFPKAGKGIVSFWTKRFLFSSLHTVAVEWVDGKVRVYNRSNSRAEPADYNSFDEFIKKKHHFIAAYYIVK